MTTIPPPLTPLTPSELSDLKAKAKAATPGPWIRFDSGGLGHPGWIMYPEEIRAKYPNLGDGYGALCWATEDGVGDVEFRRKEIDEKFIAAANPETILRLIAMIERRDGQIDTAHDALLAAQDALTNPGISAAIALQVIREALAAKEPK